MKKDQYFNLEVNLLNDDNIASMMSEMNACLLYTSPSPRDRQKSRMPSSA